MTKLIELNDVSVRYGTCEALSHVYLDIHQQDFLGIIGPNGGGKTTLVKAILKAVPYTGKVIYSKEIESGGSRRIGYMPQISDLDKTFPISVREVVLSAFRHARNCSAGTLPPTGKKPKICFVSAESNRSPDGRSAPCRADNCNGPCSGGL